MIRRRTKHPWLPWPSQWTTVTNAILMLDPGAKHLPSSNVMLASQPSGCSNKSVLNGILYSDADCTKAKHGNNLLAFCTTGAWLV